MKNFEQQTLFDEQNIDKAESKYKDVVYATFNSTKSQTVEELFTGFDDVKIITYSSSLTFLNQLKAETIEVIFGNPKILNAKTCDLIAFQATKLKQLNHKLPKALKNKVENGSLNLYITNELFSHEKLYLLSNKITGKKRVITGSANASKTAWESDQRELIIVFDDNDAFDYFYHVYTDLKENCCNHISYKAIVVNKSDDTLEYVDKIPLIKQVEAQTVVLLQPTDNQEDANFVYEMNEAAKKLKAITPTTKGFKLTLTADKIKQFKIDIKGLIFKQKEIERKFPRLHIDYDNNIVTFDNKIYNLNPLNEAVKAEVETFVKYMNGFDKFRGDTTNAQRKLYTFANWMFTSPFMAYLRYMANHHGDNGIEFPVFGMLYGESNSGKTTFIQLILKMMSGHDIIKCSGNDFTKTNADKFKQIGEGIPIFFDEMPKDKFDSATTKSFIKDDDWGIAEGLINYPVIVMAANVVKTMSQDISKRVIGCYIDISIDRDDIYRNNLDKLKHQLKMFKGAFYGEYLRRMIPLIKSLQFGKDSTFDIYHISDSVIKDIFMENIGYLPSWMQKPLNKLDYLGDAPSAGKAVKTILSIYETEPSAFTVKRSKNFVKITYPETRAYELKSLINELPPSVEAKMAGRTVTAKLDKLECLCDCKFKNQSLFDRFLNR